MTAKPAHKPKYLQSFGRLKARRIRQGSQGLLNEVLPELRLDYDNESAAEFIAANKQTWLEIGFGDGGHLLHQAVNNRDVGFIGCEPFINGTVKLVRGIKEHKLDNIRVSDADFRLIAEKIPDNSIDRCFILFADPWPKKRQHKRRIISAETLAILARIMRIGARLRIATDHDDYKKWIAIRLLETPDFTWLAQSRADWETQPADHIETKYQKKAFNEGRKSVFFELVRN